MSRNLCVCGMYLRHTHSGAKLSVEREINEINQGVGTVNILEAKKSHIELEKIKISGGSFSNFRFLPQT